MEKLYVGSDNKVRIRNGERIKLVDGRDLSIHSMEMLRHGSVALVDESLMPAVRKLWKRRNGRSFDPSLPSA